MLIRIPRLTVGMHRSGGGLGINAPEIPAELPIQGQALELAGAAQQMVQGPLHGVDIHAATGDVLVHDRFPCRDQTLLRVDDGCCCQLA